MRINLKHQIVLRILFQHSILHLKDLKKIWFLDSLDSELEAEHFFI